MRPSTERTGFIAVVLVLAGVILAFIFSGSGGQAQPSKTVQPSSSSAAPAAALPVPTNAQPGSSASLMPSSAPSQQSAAQSPMRQVVLAPANAKKRSFTVSFGPKQESDTQCAAPAKAEPTKQGVTSVVKPAEPDGHDWCDTSVWLSHWAYPSKPSTGITYVVEHACQHHRCPGTFMRCTSHCSDSGPRNKTYSVKPGVVITITTPNGILTYQVCNIGSSPKSASALQVPTCKKPVSLVVYNCEYDDDVSINNVVAAATLIGSRKG